MIENGNAKDFAQPTGLPYLMLGKYMASTLLNNEQHHPSEHLLALTGLSEDRYHSSRQILEKECAKFKSLADSLFR